MPPEYQFGQLPQGKNQSDIYQEIQDMQRRQMEAQGPPRSAMSTPPYVGPSDMSPEGIKSFASGDQDVASNIGRGHTHAMLHHANQLLASGDKAGYDHIVNLIGQQLRRKSAAQNHGHAVRSAVLAELAKYGLHS